MMKKKLIAACAAMALMGTVLVGGTLAWLTDSESVTNTFTVGKVEISLTEDGWTEGTAKKIIPGQTVEKAPIVTVAQGSEEAYVFASYTLPNKTVVINQENVPVFTVNTPSAEWEKVAGYSDLYVYIGKDAGADKVDASAAEKVLPALFASVSAHGEWDGSLSAGESIAILVKAFAIQAQDGTITYDNAVSKAAAQLGATAVQ